MPLLGRLGQRLKTGNLTKPLYAVSVILMLKMDIRISIIFSYV